MSIDYTTTELVRSLKRRASMPTSQATFSSADLVALMNDEMHSILLPRIKDVREEYFVTKEDVALVSGQSEYTIPSRAAGNALRDVVFVDANDRETPCPRLAPEDIKDVNSLFYSSGLVGHYFRDNKIVIVPQPLNPSAGFSIRMKFERRPNNLCLESAAATITAINTGTRAVTVSNQPSTWTVTTEFDVIIPDSPFVSVGDDQSISSVAANILIFDSLPDDISVGQWIAPAGESPIPQLPYEAHHVLAQLGAIKALEILGKGTEVKTAKESASEMLRFFVSLITPRNDGAQKKIVNRNTLFGSAGSRGVLRS